METKTIGLEEVLNKYGVPDPKIVGKLPKGGIQLDFVGHADVTKMLIEIDPQWSWEPTAFDADGLPAYRVENGYAHMAGWLTIHGVRRLGIGSVAHNKQDLLKELVSDFIRNAAMRFGICLSLWTKQEWDDVDRPAPAPTQPVKKAVGPPKKTVEPGTNDDDALTEEQIAAFNKACVDADLNPMSVYKMADVRFGFGKQKDLGALREAFKKAKTSKKEG
jgi:hypothetical protein